MDFKADEVTLDKINKASKWLAGTRKFGLLLYGAVGSGKTTLARSICNLISIIYGNASSYSERKCVCRVSALDLAAKVQVDPSYLVGLKNQELIFIDDLGTEPAVVKSWGNEISPVTELLYSRYDKQLFTMATSNLSDEEFCTRYGTRIADRMEEMFERLYYSHNSYRK